MCARGCKRSARRYDYPRPYSGIPDAITVQDLAQPAVPPPEQQVDREPGGHPDAEVLPGPHVQVQHEPAGGEDRQYRGDGDAGHPEAARKVGAAVAERQHAGRDEHEGEQRADHDHLFQREHADLPERPHVHLRQCDRREADDDYDQVEHEVDGNDPDRDPDRLAEALQEDDPEQRDQRQGHRHLVALEEMGEGVLDDVGAGVGGGEGDRDHEAGRDEAEQREDRAALLLDRSNTAGDAYRVTIRLYGQRNQLAHGKSLATGIDVPAMIGELYRIASELSP